MWLGPDIQEHLAETAINSILIISDFLCYKLDVSVSNLGSLSNIYHDLIFKNRETLPPPNECEFSNAAIWKSLSWLYGHPYFTRVWAIQEVTSNKQRILHIGHESTEWEKVDLTAGYIIVEPAFSKAHGFDNTYCWWATTMTELTRTPKKWLSMLYLASSYSCLDPRDSIYGL